ncbi:MAG: hydrogenase 4 subunit F [Alphaproteobacteria bacterium]|nr:MAG: hydrogenase 4 subunit F [Alphaproteobacteria bacterium]
MTAHMPHPAFMVAAVPLVAAFGLFFVGSYRMAAGINILSCLLTFICSILLVLEPGPSSTFFILDSLNTPFVVLTAFVAFTTSLFSYAYMKHEIESGLLTEHRLRRYHVFYQMFLASMLLALQANNIGLIWAALEVATLSTVLVLTISRTPAAIEAGWKYFILCGVGIVLALFGTALVLLGTQSVGGEGLAAMSWDQIQPLAARINPRLLDIAYVFLLIGYGTKAGLAPLHAWLPDAHSEGPSPLSAMLSGLLLNVALYVLLRFKMVFAANPDTLAPGPLLIIMGLASVFLAALALYRRRDAKRMLAYSSIEHMGIAAFAFGIGGAAANFAGMLHMLGHSLIKSALFCIAGLARIARGSNQVDAMNGLVRTNPVIGWTFLAGIIAIAGLPPFLLFNTEFLIIKATVAASPALAVVFLLGLLLAVSALIGFAQVVAFGEPPAPDHHAHKHAHVPGWAIWPAVLHLLLAVALAVAMPGFLNTWLSAIAPRLG